MISLSDEEVNFEQDETRSELDLTASLPVRRYRVHTARRQ
jgi:hypothetical protein